VLHHQLEALQGRLSKAVLVDELADQRRVECRARRGRSCRRSTAPARSRWAPPLTRSVALTMLPFEFGDHLLHRPARRRLDDDEIDHR